MRSSALPSGSITAAGLYHASNLATTRFDNFQIEQVPEPATFGLVAAAAVGLLARRRARAKA